MPRKVTALSAAFIAIGGFAFAPSVAWAEDGDESSVVSVHDNIVGVQVCHNHVPVNVLGVQVPIKEIAASLGVPIMSDESPQRGPDSSCNQDATGRGNEGSVGRDSRGHHPDATSDRADAERSASDGDADGKEEDEKRWDLPLL